MTGLPSMLDFHNIRLRMDAGNGFARNRRLTLTQRHFKENKFIGGAYDPNP